jgi:hypothetical protein
MIMLLLTMACSSTRQGDHPRDFDTERLEEMNASARYDYDREVAETSNGILKFFGQVFMILARLLNSVLGFVVLAALVLALVYLVARNSHVLFPSRKQGAAEQVQAVDVEDVKEADYHDHLARALQEGNYALAIRYQFLQYLKQLQQAKLIDWHREKTNFDYFLEVPQGMRPNFGKLIRIYEYVHYGHFHATEDLYRQMAAMAERIESR